MDDSSPPSRLARGRGFNRQALQPLPRSLAAALLLPESHPTRRPPGPVSAVLQSALPAA